MENDSERLHLQRLQSLLEKIGEDNLHQKAFDSRKQTEDVFMQYITAKSFQIKKLKREIDDYHNEGMHFTKQHRTLEGHCGKLQTDLDKIDVTGREHVAEMQKNLLLQVNALIKKLNKKAHPTGAACTNCEVKK